jgi:aspartyl-tRNA(Asn)/glutamyl-tRNA(Gln) amidotransferase subunit B
MESAGGLLEKYEPVIGLEVHVQLLTQSKAFCGCSTRFGAPPNSQTCPVCLGLPGALPVLNRQAAVLGMKASLAINCEVRAFSRFARKNYFYPDLPKGYQISQYDQPLAEHGWIDIRDDGRTKRIGITRLHLEDDAGKSVHDGFPDSDRRTYVDLNRSGTPLAEIVTEPDMRGSSEAYEFLTKLKEILLYLEVSDCNMEEGSLRCDANVSVRLRGAEKLGTKTEVKNLNSFRFLKQALDYEIARQIEVIEEGGVIHQETRLWNTTEHRTIGMRSKEQAHDYRYFPEPDLAPLIVSDAWREEIRATIPELPEARRARFIADYGMSEYNAGVLTSSKALAGYFEAVAAASGDARAAANWVMGDLLGQLNADGKAIAESPVSAAALGELLKLLAAGTISGKIAKDVFLKMFATGRAASEIVESEGLSQISDTAELEKVVVEVIAASPNQVEQYKSGKQTVLGYLVGQVMKATRGQANPAAVNELLKKALG